MKKEHLEKIALEVNVDLGRPCVEYYLNMFAHRFLSRIDAERGKSAVAWIGQWSVDNLLRGRRVGGVSMSPQRNEDGGLVVPLYLAPAIPEGMVLVPIEPAKEMLIEGRRADRDWCEVETDINIFESGLVAIYKAMIAAAAHRDAAIAKDAP